MSHENILDKIIAQSKLSSKETAKQQKIVEVAIKMFAEKGYANTSTSEIAKAAGVAEGTIFRHYGTKENLLLSIILPFLKELLPSIAEAFKSEIGQNFNSFEDFIRAVIYDRFEFIKSNKVLFQVVVKEFLYRKELPKEFIPLVSKHILPYINKVFDSFKASGELVDLQNNTIIRMTITSVIGFLTTRFILLPEDFSFDDELEIENLISFISKGLKK